MSDEARPGFVHLFEPAARPGAPTLLLLHGTGGDEHDLLPLVPLLVPDAAVLSLRGNVLEHGMPRFFRRLAPGVFDLEDLERRTDELARFIDTAAEEYALARDQVIAVGLSNGANIAVNLILSRPRALRAAVLLRAMPTRDDASDANAGGLDVYMSSGRRDRMIGAGMSERLAQQLRDAGASVTLAWDEGGHELTRAAIDGTREWLNALLKT